MKIKLTTTTRYIYYFASALVLFCLGANVIFLYNDFYKTIAQAEVIYLLQSQVSFEIIDVKLWNKVSHGFEIKKNNLLKTTGLKDPFE